MSGKIALLGIMENWEKEWMKDIIGGKMRNLNDLYDLINKSKHP